jgi:putative peptidoglycan lipid II flippase
MTTFSPSLAKAAAENQLDLLKEKLSHGLRLLALLMIPASVGFVLIAEPLVTALLEHGRFNAASSSLTSQTLSMFALGLFPFSAYLFLLRGFYAQQDTRTPFWLNILENILNVALAIPLMQIYGVAGLALSYALAYTIAALVTAGVLERTLKGMPWTTFLNSLWRIAGATLIMGVSIGIASVFLTTSPPLLKTLEIVVVGGMSYGGSVIAFRTPEALSFLHPFLRKG